MHKAEPYATGACQPPHSRSRRRATARAISSLHGAAAICTPMGRPVAETPQRTTAAGHPDMLGAVVWRRFFEANGIGYDDDLAHHVTGRRAQDSLVELTHLFPDRPMDELL